MIKQYLIKRAKIVYGFLNKRRAKNYLYDFWDKQFYTKGISDRQTISPEKDFVSAKYHYCSVEMQILRHLSNNGIYLNGSKILDLGTGSGHWIDFYKSFDPAQITGIDVSLKCCEHLREKHSADNRVKILHGNAIDIMNTEESKFDLVNAIGVMYHIVNDTEWENTIITVGNVLSKNGCFVIGGHFGWLDGLNVQLDKQGNINKKLRSKRHWTKMLKKAGFSKYKIYKNRAYLYIGDTLPENNVLIAVK